MQKTNIFAGILSYENNVSSLLSNLSQYKLFRKELIEFLELDDVDYKDIEIYTEVTLQIEDKAESYGRIDMMIIDKEENEYLIENKISNYRSLTENQEGESYLEYIQKNKKAKKLLFLVPKNYEHLEAIKSIENNAKDVVVIKYWQDFVKHFLHSGTYELNPFIKEFIDFLEKRFLPAQVKFSHDEIEIMTHRKDVTMNNTKIAKIMKKLIETVDSIEVNIEHRNNATYYEGGYGYRINNSKYGLNNDLFIWYGIDFDVWEEYGYPLILQVEDDVDGIKHVLSDDSFEEYEYDDKNRAFIHLFKNLQNKNLKDDMEGKIYETIKKLKNIKN